MREILFKAKSIDDGMWYESMTIANRIINNDIIMVMEIEDGNWIKVHRNSLSQFTGLKINNNIKLFEGDIFNYMKHDGYIYDNFKGYIICIEGSFGFKSIGGALHRSFTPFSDIDELYDDFINHLNIIGHIFNNCNNSK